jgi:hypothetical protein
MRHHQTWIRRGIFGLALFLAAVVAVSADTLTYALKANPSQLAKDRAGNDVFRMMDFSMSAVPGRPMLPHKIYNIALPPDVDWASLRLTVTGVDRGKIPGFFTIATCPPDTAWKDNQWLTSSTAAADGSAAAPTPSPAVSIVGTSQLRKWKFVKVEFTPFLYAPETGEITLVRRADIQLAYSRTGERVGAAALADGRLDDVARDMFLNFGEASAWYNAPALAGAAADTSSLLASDYVIITTEAIRAGSAKLNAFIAHKQDMDHTVNVVTETAWGAVTGQSPNHKAEKIREWLKSNYVSLRIKYVLLIGNPSTYESGEGDVPQKMCWPHRTGSDEEAPTDFFYADLTGNWDKDADGYFGEWSDDMGTGGVDFTPEVYVGRIPVYGADYTTLDAILQKIINYERASASSVAWRKSVLLPMSYSAAGYDGAPLAEQMRDDYLTASGWTSWRQYQQGSAYAADNSVYPSEEELRGSTVVRDRWAANDYGVVCWWGHGSATQAAVGYSPNWDGLLFDSSYCSALDDAHPAFTYQCSCTNAYPENSNNLAYAILKKGGIGSVSATRVSWFNTGVTYGFFDGSTTNSGIGYEYVKRLVVNKYEAGKAFDLTLASMTPEYNTRLMNYFDFNLYGDPSVSLQKVRREDANRHAIGDFDGDGADEVAMDFGTMGAWMWNAGSWSQLTASNPEHMIAFDVDGNGDKELAVDLGTLGLWMWNGGAWSQLSANDPEFLIAADTNNNGVDELFVDFGTLGLWWRQENGTFTQLTSIDPQNIIAADIDADGADEVVADLGTPGLWAWDRVGSAWTQLTGADANAVVGADTNNDGRDAVVAGIGSLGVWLWDAGAWTQLSGVLTDNLFGGNFVSGGGREIAGDFGSVGLWLWNGSAWSLLSGVNADDLAAADLDGNGVDEAAVDFGLVGLWVWNGGVWTQLSGVNPENILAGDIDSDTHKELIVDFGSFGVWLWNDGAWTQLSGVNPD